MECFSCESPNPQWCMGELKFCSERCQAEVWKTFGPDTRSAIQSGVGVDEEQLRRDPAAFEMIAGKMRGKAVWSTDDFLNNKVLDLTKHFSNITYTYVDFYGKVLSFKEKHGSEEFFIGYDFMKFVPRMQEKEGIDQPTVYLKLVQFVQKMQSMFVAYPCFEEYVYPINYTHLGKRGGGFVIKKNLSITKFPKELLISDGDRFQKSVFSAFRAWDIMKDNFTYQKYFHNLIVYDTARDVPVFMGLAPHAEYVSHFPETEHPVLQDFEENADIPFEYLSVDDAFSIALELVKLSSDTYFPDPHVNVRRRYSFTEHIINSILLRHSEGIYPEYATAFFYSFFSLFTKNSSVQELDHEIRALVLEIPKIVQNPSSYIKHTRESIEELQRERIFDASTRQRKDRFATIWRENNQKTSALNETYPIDEGNLRNWPGDLINAWSSNMLVEFSKIIETELQHVPFGEFFTAIRKSISSTEKMILENRKEAVILVVENDVSTSAFWTAMLIWNAIRDRVVTHIYVNDGNPSQLQEIESFIPGEKWVIYPTAVIYSKSQCSDDLDRITEYLKESSIAVVTAVIGSTAYAQINSKYGGRVVFARVPTILPTIREIIINALGEQNYHLLLEDRKSWAVNYVPDMENLLVYFDFELADSRYVPTMLIAKAPVVDVEKNMIRFWPLIQYCGAALEQTIDGVPLRNIPPANFLHFDEETRCPTTFYRNILYTVAGRRIRTFDDEGESESSEEESSEEESFESDDEPQFTHVPTTRPDPMRTMIPR